MRPLTNFTPIKKFDDNQSIFITGGTGFIGKLLIQQLLRECSDITYIYLLIRTKKGRSMIEYTKELLEELVSYYILVLFLIYTKLLYLLLLLLYLIIISPLIQL